MTPMISIVGKSESGKTTLIEKIIPELKKRGYKIGTIKHAYHGFNVDQKGKDSWRHKKAGADMTLLASPGKIAIIKNEDPESLAYLGKYFHDMDLVIVEGYKKESKAKIEIFRSTRHREPLCQSDDNLIAFVTDTDIDLTVPRFGLEDIERLADLIEKNIYEQRQSYRSE